MDHFERTSNDAPLLFDGTYEVLDVLSEGPLGTAIHVHHRGWGVDLVAETPTPSLLAWEGALADYTRELQAWVMLGVHPHIAMCHYVRPLENLPMVFREIVDGGSLADWIADGRLYKGGQERALARILQLGIEIAKALEHAHDNSVRHRDVRPANVLMTHDGVAKLAGFGISNALAKAVSVAEAHGDPALPWAGFTPAYSPLEQVRGDGAGKAVDLFAWAVSMVELFAGARTWESALEVRDLLDESDAWADADKGIPKMPTALRDMLKACLETEPSARPSDMIVLANGLAGMLEEATGVAYPRVAEHAVRHAAASLNNHAMALLDLGQPKESLVALREALFADAQALHANYNFGLACWRGAEVDDLTVIQQLEGLAARERAPWDAFLALSWAQLERGDEQAARAALHVAKERAGSASVTQMLIELCERRVGPGFALEQTVQVHAGVASAIAMDGEGRFAVTAGYDGVLRAWDTATGALQGTFAMQGPVVRAFAMTPSASIAVASIQVGHGDAGVFTWSVKAGQPLARLCSANEAPWAVGITEGGEFAVSASDPYTVAVWEVDSDEPLMTADVSDRLYTVGITKTGSQVAAGDAGGQIHVWDVETGARLWNKQAHRGPVSIVAIDADGKGLVSGGADGSVYVWRVGNDVPRCQLDAHKGPVRSVARSRDGAWLLTGGEDGLVRLWSMPQGRCVRTLEGHVNGVTGLCFDPVGRRAFVTSGDGVMRVWSIPAQHVAAPPLLARSTAVDDARRAAAVFAEALARAREALASKDYATSIHAARAARAVDGYDRVTPIIALYEELAEHASRGALRGMLDAGMLLGHTGAVVGVGISEDGAVAVSGSKDGTLRVWDLKERACKREIPVGEGEGRAVEVLDVAMLPDATAVVASSSDRALRLWNVADGSERSSARSGESSRVAVTPDASLVVAGIPDGGARVWDTSKSRIGRVLIPLVEDEGTTAIALAVGGEVALTGARNGSIYRWDVGKTRGVWRIQDIHTDAITAIAMSPDGRLAAVASQDGKVSLWDVENKRLEHVWAGLLGGARSVAITADAELVVAGGADGSMRLWQTATGRELHAWQGHSGAVHGVAIAPDARWIVSGAEDGVVRLWMVDWDLEAPK